MGDGHLGSGDAPWRSGDCGAIDSLRHIRARFVYLGYCPSRFGLGAGKRSAPFPHNRLILMSCNGNFPILDLHGRCILCNKESLGCVVNVTNNQFLIFVTCSGRGAPRRGEILR
jgi:hypothetical protein